MYARARAVIESQHDAELRARYLDDYGTDRGYDQWRHGIKVQARHPDGLRAALTRAIESGDKIGGRALGELFPDIEMWAAERWVVPAVIG